MKPETRQEKVRSNDDQRGIDLVFRGLRSAVTSSSIFLSQADLSETIQIIIAPFLKQTTQKTFQAL